MLAVVEAAKRFRKEVDRLGNLEHDGIVAVFRAGEDRGFLYFAMRFIDGYDLHEVIVDLRKIPSPREAERAFEPLELSRRLAESRTPPSLVAVPSSTAGRRPGRAGGRGPTTPIRRALSTAT